MRAAKVIAFGLVAIIIAIVAQFVRQSHTNASPLPLVVSVPAPSQMMTAEYNSSLVGLLARSSPDVWHQVAMGWNWDGGVAPLAWIIRQPQCDIGTALLVYWRGGPGWDKQFLSRDEVPAHRLEVFDLLEEVEGRLVSGFYSRQKISFNPHNDDGYDWTTSYVHIPAKRKIPSELYESTPGHSLSQPCVYVSGGLRC